MLGDAVIKTVNEVEELGYRQAKQFTKERLVEKVMQVDDTVKKNNLPFISFENTSSSKKSSKCKKKLMQNDVKLFAQLYIATQVRGGDMNLLFKHKTRIILQCCPKMEKSDPGNKADLLHCLPLINL